MFNRAARASAVTCVVGLVASVLPIGVSSASPPQRTDDLTGVQAALDAVVAGSLVTNEQPETASNPLGTAVPARSGSRGAVDAADVVLDTSALPPAGASRVVGGASRPSQGASDWPPSIYISRIGQTGDGTAGYEVELVYSSNQEVPVVEFEIYRDDKLIGSGPEPYIDTGLEPGTTYTYDVWGLSSQGGRLPVGSIIAAIPVRDRSCSLAWTGTFDSSWDYSYNWAPLVDIGSATTGPRIPTQDDHVCIDSTGALPVDIGVSASANRVSSSLPDGVVALSVSDADLTVRTTLDVGAAEVRGGDLRVKGAASFGANATDEATLALVGGSVELGAASTVSGKVVVGEDSTIAAATPSTTLTFPSVGRVESRGSTLTGVGGVTFAATAFEIDNANLAVGPGGATLAGAAIDVIGGTSRIDWSATATERLGARSGANATITDLATLESDLQFDGDLHVTDARLELTQPISSLGNNSWLRIDNALLIVNGATDNDLTSFVKLHNLELINADASLRDGLKFDSIELFDSELQVDNTLTFARALVLDGGANVVADLVTTEGAASSEGNIVVYDDAKISGHVAISGDIGMDVKRDLSPAAPHRLLIGGDLTLENGSEIRAVVDLTGSSTLEVAGTLTADGTLRVAVNEQPAGAVDERLVDAGTITGKFQALTVDGGDGVAVERDGAAYFLRGGDDPEPAECASVPDVSGMPVGGCWVPTGESDEFRTDQSLGTLPFTIGALDFELDPGEVLTLNFSSGTLSSALADGSRDAPVVMSIPVVRANADKDYEEIARITLAEINLNAWQIERELDVVLPDLFGLPINGDVTLARDDGHWDFNVPTELPEFLELDALFEFSIEPGGLRDDQIGLDEVEVVVGELLGLTEVQLDWVSDRVWSLASLGGAQGSGFRSAPLSPDASGFMIDGRIDFDPVGTGGVINVRGVVIADLIKIPDFSIGFVRTATTDQWLVTGGESSVLRRMKFTYNRTGGLRASEIFLGDAAGESGRDDVANLADWLVVDAIDLTTGDGAAWTIAGRITQPDIDFSGRLETKEQGEISRLSIAIDGARIGALAAFDMQVDLDPDEERYVISATLVGEGFTDRSGSGYIDLDDGDVEALKLGFNELPLGELATIDDPEFLWDSTTKVFDLSATVTRAGADSVGVEGRFKFTDGKLELAHLEADQLSFGFATIDDFTLDLVATSGAEPSTAFDITGRVRGPIVEGVATDEAVQGSLRWDHGNLTHLNIALPRIDLGLAHLTDANISYGVDGAAASLAGSATLETADGTTSSDADFDFTMRDGELIRGSVTADELKFAEIIAVDNFSLTYNADAPARRCSDLGATTADALWAVGGETRTANKATTVEGCLGYNDGVIVAGAVDIGDLRVGSLFTVTDMALSVRSFTTEDVAFPFGVRDVATTVFDLAATWTGPNGGATGVDGSLTVANGGMTDFEVAVPLVQLTYLVRLQDLSLTFQAGTAWDAEADTAFALAGTVLNGPKVSTLSGSARFGDGRSLEALSIDIVDVDFGLFLLDELSLVYDGTGSDTRWDFDGEFTSAGRTTQVAGDLTVDNGVVQSATLAVERIGFAGVVEISDLRLDYARTPELESWSGDAVAEVGESVADVTVSTVFNEQGLLVDGRLEVDELVWGDLFRIDKFTLDYEASVWAVEGEYVPASGPRTALDGFMVLEDGDVTGGRMELLDVKLGSLATVTRLELAAAIEGRVTGWDATVVLENGSTGSGRMIWTDGVLTEATLAVGTIAAGELFTIQDLSIAYSSNKQSVWALDGTVVADGETTTVGGELTFDDGAIVGGGMELQDFRFGPLALEQLTLVAGTSVDVDDAAVDVSTICGVPDAGAGGVRWGLTATMRVGEEGDLISLGGRLRLNDGAISEGVFCADHIAITELARLDDLVLAYTDDGETETWAGSATVRNPEQPSAPFSADANFAFANGTLTAATVSVSGLRFGEMLTLTDVLFSYAADGGRVSWQVGATVARPGPDASLSGRLDVDGGAVVGGALSVNELSFGNAFTLNDLDIEYVGRRALTDKPTETASGFEFGSAIGGGCNSTPSGNNVPSGTPTTAGAESYFSVRATVSSGGSTFRAAGSMSFSEGDLSAFDVSIACVRVGEWFTIEDFRVAYTDEGSFLVAARLGNGDDADDLPGPSVRGLANFDDGRLVGGQLSINDVSLGATRLETFDLALGQKLDGTSVWGLSVGVRNADDVLRTGTGSLTIDNGRLVAGSLEIPEISIADIIEVRNLNLGFDSTQGGSLRIWGAADVGEVDPGSLDVSVRFEEGRVVEGSFTAERVKLFQMIPVSSFSIGYVDETWTGSFGAEPETGSTGPRIEAGFEIRNGRLVSGMIGFDGDGDGEPDSPNATDNAPASGSGKFAALPLRAFYLRYCAEGSVASFCDDVSGSAWDGRIRIEIPSESAPALEAELRVRNGRFAAASILIENANIPVFLGLFLNRIEASLEIDPRLRMCGGLGLSAGAPSLMLIQIDATLSYSEEFSDYPMPTPDGCELTNPPVIPDDVSPDYHRFLIQGQGNLFPGNPLDVNIEVGGFADIQTRGYFGVGASLDLELLGGLAGINGYVEGSMFNANNIAVDHPRTGERLTGAFAQVRGGLGGELLGKDLPVGIEFVANTIGFSVCAQVVFGRIGIAKYWSGGRTRFSCKLAEFEVIVPGTTTFATSSLLGSPGSSFAALNFERTPDSEFFILPDEELLGVDVYSVAGVPDAILIAPGGQRYQVDDNDDSDGSLVATSDNQRMFVIENPPPGRWQVIAGPQSPPLSKITTYLALPDADVEGSVTEVDGAFTFHYDVADLPGQDVVFVEREVGDQVIAGIGNVSSERGDLVAKGLSFAALDGGGGQLTQSRSLESTGTTSGQFDFRPSGRPGGGEREIVALVLQDGLPRTEVVVATYSAPDAGPAAAPGSVEATPTAQGAEVTWSPVDDDGGRRVLSYRISSTRGFAAAVDGETASASLTIPFMTPGEEVTVYVEALTSSGWGDAGVATFIATTATGAQYLTDYNLAPDAVLPGSNPIVTEELIPEAPPTTAPPTTAPPTTAPPTTQPPQTVAPAPGGVLPTTGSSSPSGLGVLASVLALAGLALLSIASRRRTGVPERDRGAPAR